MTQKRAKRLKRPSRSAESTHSATRSGQSTRSAPVPTRPSAKPTPRPTSLTNDSAHSRLRKLQRRIYQTLEREAELVVGQPPESILAYERETACDFRGRYELSSKSALIDAIRSHDVTFISDYHTFAQAQRTALRLVRESVQAGEKWALGIELIPSQYQAALDRFQAGKTSIRQFHKEIRYEDHWGFPWKNYEPLFAWARERGVRCIALNSPGELLNKITARDLYSRDLWAAGIITDHLQAEPGLRMLVLYGGHHVGRSHLPAQLERVSRAFRGRALSSLSIHQNHVDTYWKLARAGHELDAQVVRFRSGAYCVFSATPWAQLQSLIGSAEGENLEGDENDEADYLSLMNTHGEMIADFLGKERVSFASLNLRTLDDADFVELDSCTSTGLAPGEVRLARALVDENERFYLPKPEVAYLATPSPNSAAEFAAVHLLHRHTRLKAFYEGGREDFFRCVLSSAFGFLGSLILNPRRKCDLQHDHARRLRQLKRGAHPAFRGEREMREQVVALFSERTRERTLNRLPARASMQATSSWAAAQAYGRILAKGMHPQLLELKHGSDEFNELVGLFFRRKNFEEACAKLLVAAKPQRGQERRAKSKAESI